MRVMKQKRSKSFVSLLLCMTVAMGTGELPFNTTVTAKAAVIEQDSVTDINEYEDNEMIVVYKTEDSTVSELPDSATEEKLTEDCSLIEVDSKAELKDAVDTLANDPNVLVVQPNYTYYSTDKLGNNSYHYLQWAYNGENNINIIPAWNMTQSAEQETIVAVVDTGIDFQHTSLLKNLWKNTDEDFYSNQDNDGNGFPGDYYGWNFYSNNNQVCEYRSTQYGYEDDHGTHVAGIIGADADAGSGVAGVASKSVSNIKIMPVKVLGGPNGSGSTDSIIKGIHYAEQNGATICNLSLGMNQYDAALHQTMHDSSMLFVCAAGNGIKATNWRGYDIGRLNVYPACYNLPNQITVGNYNSSGQIDQSSCYSSTFVNIAAPGTDIYSTVVDPNHSSEGNYNYMTGTSMASPMVTGVAAMVASYYGNLSAAQIKQAILSGATKSPVLASKVANGAKLNTYGALQAAASYSYYGMDAQKAS